MFRLLSSSLLSLALVLPLWAGTPVYTGFFSSTAIKGYDPVAYFTDQAAVEGDEQFQHQWNGVTWHFASAAHRDLFAEQPELYAPQYGGYCAYAIAAKDELVKVDPRAWSIIDGRLYLNYSTKIQKLWEAKRAEYIKTGDANWPKHTTD